VILAAGLSPAWQQILLFDQFQTGEVNRAREAHWCASGKVLNVGRAGRALGAACRTLAMIGGRGGDEIRREFADSGIDARWIETETPTRVCTTILDRATGTTTELVEETQTPSAESLADFDAAYFAEADRADVVVLTGSLPQGVPSDLYRSLVQGTSCRVVLDIRGPNLLEVLPCRPFLVKPNREELGVTFGRELTSDEDLTRAVRETIDLGAEWVVVTDGARPAMVGSADGLYRVTPPTVEVVNPIGCGDCLAAGIAVGMDEGQSPLDAIRLGMAAAAMNASDFVPARLDRQRVEEIAKTIQPEIV
jgi:1-phosphofructokinase family hexose kinase